MLLLSCSAVKAGYKKAALIGPVAFPGSSSCAMWRSIAPSNA